MTSRDYKRRIAASKARQDSRFREAAQDARSGRELCETMRARGDALDSFYAARLVALAHPDKCRAAWAERRAAILGRLVAEGAADLEDSTLARCLGPCVCGRALVDLTAGAVALGLVDLVDLDNARQGEWAGRFYVEGHMFPNPESDLAPDGPHGPFYVFDVEGQRHRGGPYATRAEALEALERVARQEGRA